MAELAKYLPRLSDETWAKFEPVSGLLVVNVDNATYIEALANFSCGTPKENDAKLILAINHETYHYFQTIATGYQYQFAAEMLRMIVKEAKRERYRQWWRSWSASWLEKTFRFFKWKGNHQGDYARAMILFHDVVGKLHPKRKVKKGDIELVRKGMMGWMALEAEANQAAQWERDALERENRGHPGDLRLMRAQRPSLAQNLDKLWAGVNARNDDGLSAMDLIEGSALIYEHALTHGRNGLEDRLRSVWDAHDDTYRKAYDVAQKTCGARALDVILPAVALALRYSNPPNAYPVFVAALNSSSPGTEMSEARVLVDRPPRIPSAGRYLGTALDVRKRRRTRRSHYRIFDDVLDRVAERAWGVDEIDLLANPCAAGKVKSFPLTVVTKDGPLGANLDGSKLDVGELGRRLALGNLVLGTTKLPRYRREAYQRWSDRRHAGAMLLLDPLQAAIEFARLGFTHSDRGDLDQAVVMHEYALAAYESAGNKDGTAKAYYVLGTLHADRKDLNRAEDMYRKCIDIFTELGDQDWMARAASNLGWVLYATHPDSVEAEALIRKALAIDEALEIKEGIAIEYWRLGRICHGRGDLGQAEELLGKSLKLYEEVGNRLMVPAIQKELDELHKVRH
jgi:tetratricopeptide (TPR) repeat protein